MKIQIPTVRSFFKFLTVTTYRLPESLARALREAREGVKEGKAQLAQNKTEDS